MTRGFVTTPRWVLVPAVAGALVVLLPLLGMVLRIDWAHLGELLTSESSLAALWLSLRTAVASTALCLVLGCPLALVLARSTVRGLTLLRSLVLLPLVLPPVVGGIALLYTFGRMGFLGGPLSSAGVDIAFTTAAVVLAQTFVALPFLVVSLEGALRTAGVRYERVAAGLGASPTRTLFRVTLPLVLPAVLSGAALSFARCLGEFGATLTFAGSLQGVTRTLPLEIYLQRETDPDAAVALSLLLVLVALLVVGVSAPSRRRRGAGFRANLTRWFAPGPQRGPDPVGSRSRSDGSMQSSRDSCNAHAVGDRPAAAPGRSNAGAGRSGAVEPASGTAAASAVAPGGAPGAGGSTPRAAGEAPGLTVRVEQDGRGVAAEFAAEPGTTAALIGANGAGKSTVFDMIAGLLAPDRGEIRVGDESVLRAGGATRDVWVPAHRRGVALMAQEPLLFPHLSVLDNVAFGPRASGAGKATARRRALAWLREVDAQEFARRMPDELSGGQAQRVAIARVLAAEPRLILLDEPLSALDVTARPRMREVLGRVLAGRTAMIVTHDPQDVAELADRVVRLERDGRRDPAPRTTAE
ncbi:ABC transporter permease [Kocuria marina]|uniref:ABC transporter permease n=1 Tax=Kocuria marina TaxID=223184 RepID=UPI003F278399